MRRDDLPNLPIPRSAKSFLRRSGSDAMKPGKQPAAYTKMVADVTHQPVKGFKNRNAGRTTAGAVIEAYLCEVRQTQAQMAQAARHLANAQQNAAKQQQKQPASAMKLPDWFNGGSPYALTKVVAGKKVPIERIEDATTAATKYLTSESERIAAGLKKDRQNAYIAYIRSNDTKTVQAKFTQRLAGKDTHEEWQPQTDQNGNQIGNYSKSGYTLETYGWNTGEKPGTVWDKVNKFGTDTKEKLDKYGGKAADMLRKIYSV